MSCHFSSFFWFTHNHAVCFSAFFLFSSFSWTCAIAFHAHYVLRTNLVDSDLEFVLEKRYIGCVALIMLCVFAPCELYFTIAEGVSGNAAFIVEAAFLLLQWTWVCGLTAHMYFGLKSDAAQEEAYKRQVLLFLVVFLLLTVQQVVHYIRIVGQYSPNLYLQHFGESFDSYMGVANVLVWSVTRTCLVTLINKGFGDWRRSPHNVSASLELSAIAFPLDAKLWDRDCFTVQHKDRVELERVYEATMSKMRHYRNAGVTSFRRGGQNEKHQLLHKFERVLKTKHDRDYIHFQSSFENTLFAFEPRDEAFAFDTKNGKMACLTEMDTEQYKSYNMAVNWYIEWLVVLDHIAIQGGMLVLFDLEGVGAMGSSPNCAMELALLFQIFGEELEETAEMRENIKLIVITESDATSGVTIDNMVEAKLQDQQKQLSLFRAAHAKCSRVLHDARASTYLRQWIDDFAQFKSPGEVEYLKAALNRAVNFGERTGSGECDIAQWRDTSRFSMTSSTASSTQPSSQ